MVPHPRIHTPVLPVLLDLKNMFISTMVMGEDLRRQTMMLGTITFPMLPGDRLIDPSTYEDVQVITHGKTTEKRTLTKTISPNLIEIITGMMLEGGPMTDPVSRGRRTGAIGGLCLLRLKPLDTTCTPIPQTLRRSQAGLRIRPGPLHSITTALHHLCQYKPIYRIPLHLQQEALPSLPRCQ